VTGASEVASQFGHENFAGTFDVAVNIYSVFLWDKHAFYGSVNTVFRGPRPGGIASNFLP
jgi:hypothetical protein